MKKYIIFVALICQFCQLRQSTATESYVSLPLLLIQHTEQMNEPIMDGGFIFKNMKRPKLICKICGKEFFASGRHLSKAHGITNKEYYFKYIDSNNKCIIPECNNTTSFHTITTGWLKYCSLACCYKKGSDRNFKCSKARKGRTFIDMYGEEEAKNKKARMSERNKSSEFQTMMKSEEYADKIRQSKLGVPRPIEMCKNLSIKKKGTGIADNNPNWKGGITELNRLIVPSLENVQWKKGLLIKNHLCFICEKDNNCQVHHLDSLSHLLFTHKITKENWREYSNILFDDKNGIVLCYNHHNANNKTSFHSVFGRKNIQKEHFRQYLIINNLSDKLELFDGLYPNHNNNLNT